MRFGIHAALRSANHATAPLFHPEAHGRAIRIQVSRVDQRGLRYGCLTAPHRHKDAVMGRHTVKAGNAVAETSRF